MKSMLFFALSFMLTFAFASQKPMVLNKQAQQRYNILTHQLRCLVCQDEDIADSNAALAYDLKKQIAGMLYAGKSNAEIKHYLVRRYGQFILYKPAFEKKTIILWVLPFLMFIFLCFGFIFYMRNTKTNMIRSGE